MFLVCVRFLSSLILLCGCYLYAENWPAWRGGLGVGKSTEKNFPDQWNRKLNVKWKIALPERGNSSPVVWGTRVFVTQALQTQGLRQLWCIDRRSGKTIWKKNSCI